MIGLGVFLVLSVNMALQRSQQPNAQTELDPVRSPLLLVTAIGCLVGGIFFVRNSPGTGRAWVRGLALAPAVIALIVIVVAIMQPSSSTELTPSPPPSVDAYGYSHLHRAAFIEGCGGGEPCVCQYEHVAARVPPDRFIDAMQEFNRSANMPMDVRRVLNQAWKTCVRNA